MDNNKDLEKLEIGEEGMFEIVEEGDIEEGDIVFEITEDEDGELKIVEYNEADE